MIRFAATLVLSICLSPLAAANDEGGGGECRKQVQELCPDLKPGDGKFADCLKEHKDDLSEECRAKAGAKMRMAAGADACKADGEKLCPGMKPGDGKLGPCMKEHREKVSKGCLRMMRKMAKGAHKKKAADDDKNDDEKGDDGKKSDGGDKSGDDEQSGSD